MREKNFGWVSSALCLIAILAGCGGGEDKLKSKRPKVTPAEGVVTYKGTPVEGATVVFAPTDSGPEATAASAETDSEGRFALSAFPPDPGAVPGKYQVSITKVEAVPEKPDAGHDQPAGPPPKSLIPVKYGTAQTSGLTADIPEAGKTDLKFELND